MKPLDITGEVAAQLECAFNIADEVYDGLVKNPVRPGYPPHLTLADLDQQFVDWAKKGCKAMNLAWPPYLPELEELMLDHGRQIRELASHAS